MVKSRRKIFLCSAIAVLTFAMSILTCLGMLFNYVGDDIAVFKTNNSIVKLQLTEKVTLDDDSSEKLSKKIRVISAIKTGSIGQIVKVTDDSVMFSYSVNGEDHYFSAFGDKLNNESRAKYTTTSGTVNVSTDTQLAAISENVAAGDTYEGSTINIQNDIYLSNKEWTPIGNATYPFKGKVMGNNHTISNFKIVQKASSILSLSVAGLFGFAQDASFNNINIKSANFEVENYICGGALVGFLVSDSYNGCEVVGCSVDSSSKLVYTSTEGAGGLIGIAQNTYIFNCGSYASVYVTNGAVIGGLAAGITHASWMGSCESTAQIVVSVSSEMLIGGLVGSTAGDSVDSGSVVITRSEFNGSIGVTGTDAEVEELVIGGIVGGMQTFTTVTNCFVNIQDWNMGEIKFKTDGESYSFYNKTGTGDSSYTISQYFKLIYPIYGAFYYTTTAEAKVVLGIIPVGKTQIKQYTMTPGYKATYVVGVTNFLLSPQNYVSEVKYLDFVVSNCYFTGSTKSLNSDWQTYAELRTDI